MTRDEIKEFVADNMPNGIDLDEHWESVISVFDKFQHLIYDDLKENFDTTAFLDTISIGFGNEDSGKQVVGLRRAISIINIKKAFSKFEKGGIARQNQPKGDCGHSGPFKKFQD